MRCAKQVERFFVPEIDTRLQPDGDLAMAQLLQELSHGFSYAEDFVDPIDVIDAAGNHRVHFLQDRAQVAFAELISE